MRPNNPNKRLRGRNRSKSGGNPLARSYESNGPDVKIRGSALQVADKYAQLARDAQSSGDRVMAENYLQHAEHYYRIVAAAYEQNNQRPPHIRPEERRFDGEGRGDQPHINGYDGMDEDEDGGLRRSIRAGDRYDDGDDDGDDDGPEHRNGNVHQPHQGQGGHGRNEAGSHGRSEHGGQSRSEHGGHGRNEHAGQSRSEHGGHGRNEHAGQSRNEHVGQARNENAGRVRNEHAGQPRSENGGQGRAENGNLARHDNGNQAPTEDADEPRHENGHANGNANGYEDEVVPGGIVEAVEAAVEDDEEGGDAKPKRRRSSRSRSRRRVTGEGAEAGAVPGAATEPTEPTS